MARLPVRRRPPPRADCDPPLRIELRPRRGRPGGPDPDAEVQAAVGGLCSPRPPHAVRPSWSPRSPVSDYPLHAYGVASARAAALGWSPPTPVAGSVEEVPATPGHMCMALHLSAHHRFRRPRALRRCQQSPAQSVAVADRARHGGCMAGRLPGQRGRRRRTADAGARPPQEEFACVRHHRLSVAGPDAHRYQQPAQRPSSVPVEQPWTAPTCARSSPTWTTRSQPVAGPRSTETRSPSLAATNEVADQCHHVGRGQRLAGRRHHYEATTAERASMRSSRRAFRRRDSGDR